jgi:mannitol-1-phosphate 5-dehydrogenase
MNFVMYGAGNIGRGFIAPLFSQAAYHVTFIDVADNIVGLLHTRKEYPLRLLSNNGSEDFIVANVDAINGKNVELASETIADADIMATAVGANILPFIAPVIAKGLQKRFAKNKAAPLDIIICENLMNANTVLRDLIEKELNGISTGWVAGLLDTYTGFVEASIGRMVPVQTPEMQDGDPLRVCAEPYSLLPVDKDAFKGPVPKIEGLIPASPFDFYIKRKLYIHNLGHATCAYLGIKKGYQYIWQAVADTEIKYVAQGAMTESAEALAREYSPLMGHDLKPELEEHINDLLFRFANKALADTCARVARDAKRKLGADDRFIGAAKECQKYGVKPLYICKGAAAALDQYMKMRALEEVSGVVCDSEISTMIVAAPSSDNQKFQVQTFGYSP